MATFVQGDREVFLAEGLSLLKLRRRAAAMGGDLDQWIASIRNCELLPEHDLKHLCEYVQELMLEESTVQPVQSPVTICGDIHGQVREHQRDCAPLTGMLAATRPGGAVPHWGQARPLSLQHCSRWLYQQHIDRCPNTNYLFMGDYVDRGC